MHEVSHSVFTGENRRVLIHCKGLSGVCLYEDKIIMIFSKNLEVRVGGKHQELRKKCF